MCGAPICGIVVGGSYGGVVGPIVGGQGRVGPRRRAGGVVGPRRGAAFRTYRYRMLKS